MKNDFGKLLAVFAIIAIAAGIGFSQFMGAGADQEGDGLTKSDVQEIVKDYINENPGIIVEAFQKHRQQQQEEQQRQQREQFLENKDDILASDYSPVVGNESDDAVVVVEFFDYNCGYCKRAIDDVNKVIDEHNVKFIFKEFPILSESSRTAARYALAAQEQGKYLEYHTALMEYKGQKNEENLLDLAEEIGLDPEKLKEDAQSGKVEEELQKNKELAQKIGVRGTPAFIIGDNISPGYIPYSQMKTLIEQAQEG